MCVVGVDNGGTWVRLIGLDPRGRRVWSLKKPSPSVHDLPAFLLKHLNHFHGTLEGLVVGSRGVWKQAKRQLIRGELEGLAKRIWVMSDVEAAWMAAFAHNRDPCTVIRAPKKYTSRATGHGPRSTGVIVIAGTGSIAYGRSSDGKSARAGGLGPEEGDEGSGYWIGKEWIRKSKGAREHGNNGASDVRRIAALAPLVIRKAKSGNSIAQKIIQVAQSHLADSAREVAFKLRWKKNVPLCVSGSVLKNDWFRRGFLRRVKERGIHFRYQSSKQDVPLALAKSIQQRVASPK